MWTCGRYCEVALGPEPISISPITRRVFRTRFINCNSTAMTAFNIIKSSVRLFTLAVLAATTAGTVARSELAAQAGKAKSSPPAATPSSAVDPFRLDAPLPVDAAVKTGTLPNGLRYYIRKNSKPEKRVELRLVVNAGSVLEDENQRGLAHFIEHMAFNGTAHFAKNDVVKYLESIGVRFGADLNASTSFDETIYILPVPTDSAGFLDKSFQFLADIASNITFDSTQVVGERGVVLEEWRGRLGAGERV